MVLRDDENVVYPMLEDLVRVVGRARPDLESSSTVRIAILHVQAFIGRKWSDETPIEMEDLLGSPDIRTTCLFKRVSD